MTNWSHTEASEGSVNTLRHLPYTDQCWMEEGWRIEGTQTITSLQETKALRSTAHHHPEIPRSVEMRELAFMKCYSDRSATVFCLCFY